MSGAQPPGDEKADATMFSVSDVLQGRPEVVHTRYGAITVTVFGDRSKSHCLAYHEVGLNHRTCFQSLIVASGPQSLLLKNYCIVFVDAPGCQAPDAEVPAEALPLTLEKLGEQVEDIISGMALREVLGLGVGNGANVIVRAAAAQPRAFAGLVLISPSCGRTGWWEWAMGRVAATRLQYQGWAAGVREHFAQRLFSTASLQLLGGDSDLIRGFHRDMQAQVPPVAAMHYLNAALTRTDLTPLLKQLRCRVLLLYGSQALYESDSLALAAGVDKTRFALVELPATGVLVNEERPAELLSPLQLFLTALQLEGFGLGAAAEVGS